MKYWIIGLVGAAAAAYFLIDWETIDLDLGSWGDRDARRMTADEYKIRMIRNRRRRAA